MHKDIASVGAFGAAALAASTEMIGKFAAMDVGLAPSFTADASPSPAQIAAKAKRERKAANMRHLVSIGAVADA